VHPHQQCSRRPHHAHHWLGKHHFKVDQHQLDCLESSHQWLVPHFDLLPWMGPRRCWPLWNYCVDIVAELPRLLSQLDKIDWHLCEQYLLQVQVSFNQWCRDGLLFSSNHDSLCENTKSSLSPNISADSLQLHQDLVDSHHRLRIERQGANHSLQDLVQLKAFPRWGWNEPFRRLGCCLSNYYFLHSLDIDSIPSLHKQKRLWCPIQGTCTEPSRMGDDLGRLVCRDLYLP